MKRLVWVYLFVTLIVGVMVTFSNASASTPVSSIIATDTTWTAANSPYQFTGPVCVLSGVTLTIELGVTVDFDYYYLRVNGTLRASGTNDRPITFTTDKAVQNPMQQIQFTVASTSWNDQTNSGSIIENVVFNRVSIDIRGSSLKIVNNVFNNAIWVTILSRGGSPIISDNVFQKVEYQGISVDRSAIVTNNLFNLTTGQATAIVGHDNALISNNRIIGYYNGINVDSQVTVTGNAVSGCSNAGLVGNGGSLSNNYVYNNFIGISIESGGSFQNNAVVSNEIGIQIKSKPVQGTVSNNNIVSSKQYSVKMEALQNVDLPNNWWGTTDIQTINQTIRDFKSDFNLGRVNYLPFLAQPNPQAPQTADIDSNTISTPSPSIPDTTLAPITPQPTNLYIAPTSTPSDPLAIDSPTELTSELLSTENIVIVVVVACGVVWTAILVFTRRRPKEKVAT